MDAPMEDHNETAAILHTSLFPSCPALASVSAEAERQQTFDETADLTAGIIARYSCPDTPALSLVSCIPPELLEYIFSDLLDDPVSVDDSTEEDPSIYPEFIEQIVLRRINVTHVCRSWRKVAINYPALWTYIPLNLGPSWTDTLLSRSHSHPVSIVAHSALDLQTIQSVPGYLSRIQSIHVSAEPEVIRSLLEKLTEPAPVLRSMTLYPNASGTDVLELPQIDSAIFNGYAPLLDDVRIANCTIPYLTTPHIIGRNLTTLHLGLNFGIGGGANIDEDNEDDMDERYLLLPRLEHLLLLLKETPLLEVLQVRGAPGIYSNSLVGVSLHNLRSLTLVGGYHKCFMLNECIVDTQPDILLNLQCHIDPFDGSEEDISEISRCLRHHVSHLGPDICSSRVDIEINADQFKLSAENVCSIQARLPSERATDRDWAIQESIHRFPLAASTTLRMNICCSVDAAALITMLCNDLVYDEASLVQNITSLTVTGWGFDLGMLCTTLQTVDTDRESNDDEQHASPFIVLPELSSLCIESFSFGWPPSYSFQRQLLHMLDVRCQAGKPIRRFELKNCDWMSRSWYRKLAALATDVQTTVCVDDFTASHSIV